MAVLRDTRLCIGTLDLSAYVPQVPFILRLSSEYSTFTTRQEMGNHNPTSYGPFFSFVFSSMGKVSRVSYGLPAGGLTS